MKAAVALLLLVALLTGAYLFAAPYLRYRELIYPHIKVGGVDVGGLTVEAARARLAEAFPAPEQQIVLRVAEKGWRYTLASLGVGYDVDGMARAAFAVGRERSGLAALVDARRVTRAGVDLPLRQTPADPARIRAALQALAAEIDRPTREAALQFGPGTVTALPGQDGRKLDVEASLIRVQQAIAAGKTEVTLAIFTYPAQLIAPEPAYSQAREMLREPLVLVLDDPLTGFSARAVLPIETLSAWFSTQREETGLTLRVDEEALRGWLEAQVLPLLGTERTLDVDALAQDALTALWEGQHTLSPRIEHPAQTYVVRAGDSLAALSRRFGMPLWRILEANPGLAADQLYAGETIIIPSIDVLFPYPLVPGKRIEIDLRTQRLRAYEDDRPRFEFIISSGLPDYPTLPGRFQVLLKEPEAYATRWDLQMPYFMGIYLEGPDFYNGIHELPINAAGQRLWSGYLGRPASFGCIILNVGDAQALYDWAPLGTLVIIRE